MELHFSTAGTASLLVDGDPTGCRAEAVRLRSLAAAASLASDLFTSYGTAGISGFLGETATVFQDRCSTDPGSQTVADRAVAYAAGLERLADDLVDVRSGMDDVRDVARRHGLTVGYASVHPPRPGQDAAAWKHVCRLLAWQRRRERTAQQRWLAVLDRAQGRTPRPIEGAGPEPAPLPDALSEGHPGSADEVAQTGPAGAAAVAPVAAAGSGRPPEPTGAGPLPGHGQPSGHGQPAGNDHHAQQPVGANAGSTPGDPVVAPTSTSGAPVSVIPAAPTDGLWVAQPVSPASWVAVAWEDSADTAPAVLGTAPWHAR